MPQLHQQVSGGACSLTMYMERSPGKVAAGTKGIKLAFMSESMSRGSSKQQRTVITGKRGPGKPFEGLPQMSGGVQAASYSPQLGYLMRALCGAATSTPDPVRTLDAAAVVDLDEGIAGLPCKDHGFVQDAVITIHGTQHYDGQYRVEYGVGRDVIAINAPYVAEVLPASAIACRGRAPLLSGVAVDLGSGRCGLPVLRGVHALHTGENVTISGTLAYDGTYLLQPGTADGVLVINASYEDEAFDGTAMARPVFYRHAFALPKRQPTVCMEKYLDFEADAAVNRYQRFGFCKVNGFSCNYGGADELVFSLDFAVGKQQDAPEPLDPNPELPPGVPLDNIECGLWVSGVRRGDVETGTFNNTFGITPRAAVGDLGQYSRMPEGDPECTATMNAFLEEVDYQELSRARSTVPFSLSVCGASGDELWLHYPETELDVPGTPIPGKEGLMQEITVMAFVDRGDSVLTMELINRVSAYA